MSTKSRSRHDPPSIDTILVGEGISSLSADDPLSDGDHAAQDETVNRALQFMSLSIGNEDTRQDVFN
jgi:hypothetical protein